MEEARAVLAGSSASTLSSAHARSPRSCSHELRELVREAETWATRERDPDAIAAAQRLVGACDSRRVTLVHWDDVEGFDVPESVRPLGGRWQRLARRGGQRPRRPAARRARAGADDHAAALAPAEEEIFHVLRRLRDALAGRLDVHRRGGRHDRPRCGRSGAHADRRATTALEVLVFGTRLTPEVGVPAAHERRRGSPDAGRDGERGAPWEAEAALGIPDGEPGERPTNVVAVDDVEGDYGGMSKRARRRGRREAERPQLDRAAAERGGRAPHCHSADEEVFVVLDGEGTFELWGPAAAGGAAGDRAGGDTRGPAGPRRLATGRHARSRIACGRARSP